MSGDWAQAVEPTTVSNDRRARIFSTLIPFSSVKFSMGVVGGRLSPGKVKVLTFQIEDGASGIKGHQKSRRVSPAKSRTRGAVLELAGGPVAVLS